MQVGWDRVIRTSVGLRPARRSGFRLETERHGEKVIIHNYGHGSFGVTLSWGTAHLAVEHAAQTGEREFAVIGCGAVGLATARLLQKRGHTVTIYAREIPPNTTSDHAEAIWDVGGRPGPPEAYVRAARLSHPNFRDLIGERYGVRWIEQYSEDSEEMRFNHGPESSLSDLYPGFLRLAGADHPFPTATVLRWFTLLIEPPIYLKAVLQDFLEAGGRLVVRGFADFEALLSLPQRAIVNCTGLGARTLVNDERLYPVKGQLTILKPQPEIDYTTDVAVSMVPRKDGILLGSTSEPNVWTLEPNEDAMQRYMNKAARFFQAMR